MSMCVCVYICVYTSRFCISIIETRVQRRKYNCIRVIRVERVGHNGVEERVRGNCCTPSQLLRNFPLNLRLTVHRNNICLDL